MHSAKRGFYMGGRIPTATVWRNTVIDNIRTSVAKSEESEQLKLIYSMYADTGNSHLGTLCGTWTNTRLKSARGAELEYLCVSVKMLRNPVVCAKYDIDVYQFFKVKAR